MILLYATINCKPYVHDSLTKEDKSGSQKKMVSQNLRFANYSSNSAGYKKAVLQ